MAIERKERYSGFRQKVIDDKTGESYYTPLIPFGVKSEFVEMPDGSTLEEQLKIGTNCFTSLRSDINAVTHSIRIIEEFRTEEQIEDYYMVETFIRGPLNIMELEANKAINAAFKHLYWVTSRTDLELSQDIQKEEYQVVNQKQLYKYKLKQIIIEEKRSIGSYQIKEVIK